MPKYKEIKFTCQEKINLIDQDFYLKNLSTNFLIPPSDFSFVVVVL